MPIATESVVLVTGASGGIGEAAARALRGAGFNVYTAGSGAGRVSMLRRLVPARVFEKQIRKANRTTTKETRR